MKAVEEIFGLRRRIFSGQEKELAEQTEYLSERLVTVYEDGEISYLEVLFSSADIADFLTRYDLLREIVPAGYRAHRCHRKGTQPTGRDQQGLQVKKSRLISTQEAKKSQENYLGEQADQKNKALKAIENDRQAYESSAGVGADFKRAGRIIRSMQKPDVPIRGPGVFAGRHPTLGE